MTARAPARTKAGSGVLRFRDLGPLVVDRDGEPVPLGGGRLVGALTLLLVHAGPRRQRRRARPTRCGASEAGPRSSSTLDSHIWRLRNVLEPGRAPRRARRPCCCASRGATGCVAAPDQVDSLRFAVLADEAAAAC